MHQLDEVREALDQEFSSYGGRSGDWEDVLVRSMASEPEPRKRRSPLIALAAAVVALAASALLWPGGDGSDRILERARAVVMAGPVIHLVFASEDAPMTEVDLESGTRRRLQGRHEQWFDPERGVHDLHTIDGRVYRDVLYPTGSSPELEREFLEFASAYRDALESGRASVGGKAVLNGRDVYWIRFHSRYPSIGITYDADHEVAVDAETFEPRLWRSTRENEGLGIPRTTTELQIEFWETLPAGRGDFTAAMDASDLPDDRFQQGLAIVGRPRTLTEARSVLSRPPLWLGGEFHGLALTEIDELVLENLQEGSVVEKIPALSLCYVDGRGDVGCARGARHVVAITETNVPHTWFGWEQAVVPAEGTLLILHERQEFVRGFVHELDAFVTIAATDEELLVAAARALRPMTAASGGSGGGG